MRSISVPLAETCRTVSAESLFTELQQREELGSTGIGGGVAIPHCKIKGLKETLLAVVTTEKPVDYNSADDQPVSLLLVLVSPAGEASEHLKALASISRWLQEEDRLAQLTPLAEPAAIEALFSETSAT